MDIHLIYMYTHKPPIVEKQLKQNLIHGRLHFREFFLWMSENDVSDGDSDISDGDGD